SHRCGRLELVVGRKTRRSRHLRQDDWSHSPPVIEADSSASRFRSCASIQTVKSYLQSFSRTQQLHLKKVTDLCA
ncbi:hypothetical protein CSUI_011135, partial [Cystoisospora suis]